MIHVQTYYLTAVLALILSGISLLVSLVSLAVSERHRKAERADKQASREADLAYKYSKEVQVSFMGLCNSVRFLSSAGILKLLLLSSACPYRGREVQATEVR